MSLKPMYVQSPSGVLIPVQGDANGNLIVNVASGVTNKLSSILYGTVTTPGDTAVSVNNSGAVKVAVQNGSGAISGSNPLYIRDDGGTQVQNSATAAAAAALSVNLPRATGVFSYLTGFILTSAAPTSTVSGLLTITGVQGGTLNFQFTESSTNGGLLALAFPTPVQSSALNTFIAFSLAAITGGAATAITVFGYQL